MQASMIAWVVTYVLHSTILVLGAWLLERRWGDRPERMSAVWKTALVGGLLTATVQTGLGVVPAAGRWALSDEVTSEQARASAAVGTSVREDVRGTERVGSDEPLASNEPVASAGAGAVVASAGDHGLVATTTRPSWPPPDWQAATVTSLDAVDGTLEDDGSEPSSVPVPSVAATTEPTTTQPAEAPVLASVGASVEPTASAPSGSAWATVVPWALVLAGVGAVVGLGSVLLAFVALRRQLRDRRPLSEGSLPTLLEGLQRRARLPRPVPLTVAPRVRVPMAVGVLRPEIVVPPQAAHGLPLAHQESLLAHELAHVLRHDPAWRLVALLVERVFFFQPLNRLASRRLAQSAEYLCDDWAARHTRQPLALARCLTEIASWVARPGPVAATMSGPRSILGRRVQRLLQPTPTSARPWWLTAALGVPLLAVVAMAPGVDARAARPGKGDEGRKEQAAEIVVIDAEGRRHEVRAPEGGAVVVREQDGRIHVEPLDDDEALAAIDETGSPREARKARRARERAIEKARREAKKDLRRAFREAKQRGEAAPSRRELEAILRRARQADGRPEGRGERGRHPRHEHVEVHVVTPDGVAVHGRVPIDLEGLEALEVLEGLEELEELGPMLEEIERELEEAGIDVVIRHRDGAADPELRVIVPPGHVRGRPVPPEHAQAWREAVREASRAQREAERAMRDAEREQARHEAAREAHRAARERAREQAREHLRHDEHRRDAQREADRLRREAEQLRHQLERLHEQDRERSSEMPMVRRRAPAPPHAPAAPHARARQAFRMAPPPPAPLPPGAPSPHAAPAPRAPGVPVPLPRTRVAPQPPPAAGQPSVVWVSDDLEPI